jgi:hypothetical protein
VDLKIEASSNKPSMITFGPGASQVRENEGER